jgi:adenine-specific DNA-methyltransferase
LLSPKVLTGFKRFDRSGESAVTTINRDAEINRQRGLSSDTITDNLLIKGNNLLALHSLQSEFAGKVKLIYIDPPYNIDNDSFQYNDGFNHSTWLTFMRNRLEVAKAMLSSDGFIFIQINDIEVAYLQVLSDEIFGRENFLTSICVKMSHLSGTKMAHKEKKIPKIKEYILMYAKSKSNVKLNPEYIACTWEEAFDRYKSFIEKNGFSDDECDQWTVITLNQALKKYNIDKEDTKAVNDFKMNNAECIFRTSVNRSADYSKYPPDRFSKHYKNTDDDSDYTFVFKGEDVNFASEKIREINGNQVPTTAIGDIWTDIGINNLSNEGGVSLRFGKKPEKLIARIVNIASNPKDIVMDFFTGSGTTIAVCHKLSRQYIGIEQLNYNENDSLVRLSNVINGENVGLGDLLNWQGGGSFIYCELAKANQTFIDRIQNATSTEELLDVWQWMQEKSFISYKVDIKSIDNSKSEFASLSLGDQKRFLIEVMDKNMLYVPLSEIDDETYGISDEDKQLNATFYSREVH